MEVIHRRVGESDLRALLDQIVHAYPSGEGRGLPIGALTSQHLANLYLGVLDHYVKDDLGVRRYLRYMDDFAVFGTKEEVLQLRRQIALFLYDRLGLSLNERTSRVLPVPDGVPMLGMRVYPAMIRISRSRWQRFQKRHRAVEQQLSDGTITEEQAAAILGVADRGLLLALGSGLTPPRPLPQRRAPVAGSLLGLAVLLLGARALLPQLRHLMAWLPALLRQALDALAPT